MQKRIQWALMLGILIVGMAPRQAAAYWDDVHYHLTYYVARLVGYTPQQAYRIAAANLSTDYHPATEPTQLSPTDALLGVPDPQPPEKQNPRWWFHAFRNQTNPLFADAIGSGGRAAEADAAILAQRTRLFRHGISVRNPGIFLHFLQDEAPHQGFGSAWGHWFNPEKPVQSSELARRAGLPIGGSVDWLDFDRHFGQGSSPKSAALDMARETQLWLERFMAEVSPRQKRRETSLLEMEAVIDGLLALGPAPRPLATGELKTYTDYKAFVDYKIGTMPAGLTAEQLETFRRHKDGPDLKAAEALVNAALQGMGTVEKAVPPYGRAQKQYQFKVTGDSSVFPTDAKGELSQKAVDDWVLTGSLKVTLEAEASSPQEPVEVRIRATRTINGQSDYDLIEPMKLSVGSSATWEHLPIGEFTVELYRDGWGLNSQRVELKAAHNETTVRVPTPFDWSGRWDIEYQPQENGPWVRLGVMTWRKVDEKEALEFKEKRLGTGAAPCLFGKIFASFLADFPWGGGGKMAGFACSPDGRTLEGRYGHTQHFSSWLGGMKGYIRMTLNTDNQGFQGSFIQDFEAGNWHAWRGKRLGP